ncbi:heavy-metal-associated domain-containing protein [Bacteroidetes/Chlorobi group bacterium Naka2016]|jgi:copper chaperone CopZ|nr:MAG: heavy-metal-associated domain-containing protein [Bacteroidetes/Chlorobi group bacterium Naka2016]
MKRTTFIVATFVAIALLLPFATFAKVTEVKLITNAHCAGCKTKIEKALKKIDGVQEANLDLPTKIALVKFDDEMTKVESLISALQKIGYDAKVYEGDKEYQLKEHKDVDCKGKNDDPKCKENKSDKKSDKK